MSPLASPYNDPTQFGLEILHVLEEQGDVLVVWHRVSDGALFYAHDTRDQEFGDEPFEAYGSVDDLMELEPETFLNFEVELDSFLGSDIPDDVLQAINDDVYGRLKAQLSRAG